VEGKPVAVSPTVCEIERGFWFIAGKTGLSSTPDDLRGKTIGLVVGSAAEFFLHVYLTTSYISPKDVRIVGLPTDNVVNALLKGEVDAVSTWAPHTIVLRDRLGGQAVIFHDPNIYTMTWNIAARADFVKSHPDPRKKIPARSLPGANRFIANILPRHARSARQEYRRGGTPFREGHGGIIALSPALDQSLILNLEDQARWDDQGVRPASREDRASNFLDFIHTDAGLKAVRGPEGITIVGKSRNRK